ncbi:phage/plasmid primase, P4 family [Lacticaseibacillus paracasei]|uniref:phage/plasmid primase, P4 family n=1 Tax=Lacticaseibacillus paracasei TaxID=1597 RepID=UPI0021A891F9|nr:phage/plasmid primase, P4 family [Lacticaseibacillus paracasei]MCT2893965.1 DNA primase [Lacticaseibacillus paracasei]
MYERIPAELRSLKQWGCFHRIWQPEKNKYTKIPYSALTGTKTSSTDSKQWVTFEEAITALQAYDLDGLGFFFANGYVGIDVDHIGDDLERLEEGQTDDNVAWEFMNTFKSYTERSMSGTGIHIIVKGEIPGTRRRKANVEMYQSGRFFAMTGDEIGKFHSINSPTKEEFKRIYTKYLEPKTVIDLPSRYNLVPNNLSEDEIIIKMLKSKSGDRIKKLLNGGWEPLYPSQSEADLAFANDLAFWTGRDFTRMDSIFRHSSLMRPKWDEKHGKTTYGVSTLNRAINDVRDTYQPKHEKPKYKLGFITDTGKPKAFPPRSWDDTGNAQRFVDHFGDAARYSYVDKAWYVYNGSYWELDKQGKLGSMVDIVVDDMKREKIVIADGMDPEEAKKKWSKFLKQSRSNSAKKAMTEQLRHRLAVMPEEFDRDKILLNTINGYVDLSDGELHDHDVKKMFSKETGVEYTDTVDAPEWRQFLDQIFDHDEELIDYLQKAIGYSLTGSTEEQVMFILYGNGRNGKSVFMDTLKHVAGSYAKSMSAKSIMIKQSDSAANSDIARLKGARLVTASEPNEGVRLDEGLVKELTGGDMVTARFLYGSEFEYKPEFKLWLATNHKPIIRGTDDGIWRRLMLIPFNVQIPENKVDKRLAYKLERESVGILNWAVDGALKWQREGLKAPASVQAASKSYRAEMDTLELFVRDCCDLGPDYQAPAGELFKAYQSWAESNGEYKMRKQKFGAEMKQKFRSKKNSSIFYLGLKIKSDPRLNWAQRE